MQGGTSAGFHGGAGAAAASCFGSGTLGFQGGIIAATLSLGGATCAEGSGAAFVSEATGLKLTAGEDLGVFADADPARGGWTISEGLAAGLFRLRDPHPPAIIGAAEGVAA